MDKVPCYEKIVTFLIGHPAALDRNLDVSSGSKNFKNWNENLREAKVWSKRIIKLFQRLLLDKVYDFI